MNNESHITGTVLRAGSLTEGRVTIEIDTTKEQLRDFPFNMIGKFAVVKINQLEPEPEESQPFRIAFLELASDLKPRTVKQIRESLNLPESSNVGESLRSLQACLAGDETAVVRLRSKKSQSRSHSAIWWLERK